MRVMLMEISLNKIVNMDLDIAAKYQGQGGALDKLMDKVKNGGSGVWGSIPMPPQAQLSDEDRKALVTWVLSGGK